MGLGLGLAARRSVATSLSLLATEKITSSAEWKHLGLGLGLGLGFRVTVGVRISSRRPQKDSTFNHGYTRSC